MTEHGRLKYCVAAAVLTLVSCSARQYSVVQTPRPSAVAQTLRRQVVNAVDLGEGDYQTRALRKRVVAEPGNLAARLELATRYRASGAPELALEHFRIAAAQAPPDSQTAILLARTLRDFDQSKEAVAVLVGFCTANQTQPPELLSLLGTLRDDAGEFVEAEHTYRAALDHHPELAYLHNNLGYNLLLQARPKLAASEFQEALKLEPRSEFAHNNLGLALVAQWKDDSQPKEALLHWQSVSDPATAHNNLATVLIEQGRFKEARTELDIALSYARNHAAARANLALVAELDGKPSRTRTVSNSFWKRVKTVFTTQQPAVAVESARK